MGGELGETIKQLSGKEFMCLGVCGKPIMALGWLAEEHDGGLADATGKKWRLWIECDTCHYQTAWWKISNRVKVLELEKTNEIHE